MAVTVARALGTLLAYLTVFLMACEKPTEIVVTIDTDMSPQELSRVEIELTGPDGELRQSTLDHNADNFPARVGLVHEGGPLGPITIRAVGLSGGTEIVEREAVVSFRPEQIVRLSLNLLRRCVGETCSASMTCGETGCRSREIAPEELESWDGVPERISPTNPDAGGATDAETGPPGGGSDGSPDATPDATPDTGPDPDAAPPCTGTDVSCSPEGNLVSCIDGQTITEPCPLGCNDELLRCSRPVPSNVDRQLWTKAFAEVTIANVVTLDTDDCDTTAFSPAPATEIVEVADGPDLCVLIMAQLTVSPTGRLEAHGSRALVLLVTGEALVEGVIDASSHGTLPGPGGALGGAAGMAAPGGACGGGGGENSGTRDSGGGGGGGGAPGGAGGEGGDDVVAGGTAGAALDNSQLVPLLGGCGGGGGGTQPGSDPGGAGGAGGGALQLTVGRSLIVAAGGLIWAGGGAGQGGGAQSAGGGGGAGGGILLEAPTVTIAGAVAANGGGGGASNNPGSGDGEDGTEDASRAAGGSDSGNGSEGGGPGGAGGSGVTCHGGETPDDLVDNGGGGGGGVGIVRMNTESGFATVSGTVSPSTATTLTYGRVTGW
jgi:hypothetical protein